jgi:hypothetical protein
MALNFVSLLDTVSIRVPTYFTTFCCSSNHCPLATLLLMQSVNLEIFRLNVSNHKGSFFVFYASFVLERILLLFVFAMAL